MNGARSIFMSKGYWLTALATAVLLAASSGTALAQMGTASVGFDRASTSVTEGDTDSDDLAIIKVVRTAIEDEDLEQLEVTVRVGAAMPEGSSGGFRQPSLAEGGTVSPATAMSDGGTDDGYVHRGFG